MPPGRPLFLRPAALTLLLLSPAPLPAAPAPDGVAATYADIALAAYGDSLATARALQDAVAALVRAPSATALDAARAAWVRARVPYLQTEVFRFGNPIVDAWEGRVNAWPLDEGLIDYVAQDTPSAENNALAGLNVIANPALELAGTALDASTITPDTIRALHEAGGIEANVASGYHAVEFLLWGQDLNGTGPGAGERPFTDFVSGAGCTNGNCERRGQYLLAAAELLVADLAEMTRNWDAGGPARQAVTADPQAGLRAMLTGMGSLSYGELAGERMKLGLMLNDPEEEQDCFSDQTVQSHYNDALGIRNVYAGRYVRVDGTVVAGPSLSGLVAAADPGLDQALRAGLDDSVAAMDALRDKAADGMAYDQMLAPGNAEGAAAIQAGIESLLAQTVLIDRAAGALGLARIAFEGSDSLDNPGAVFQ